jgi:antirestriction protein ArdC
MQDTTDGKDVYSRITAQIVEYLEKGVRPWTRPWNAEHAAGRITRPLRLTASPFPESTSCPCGCPLSARTLRHRSG